MDRAAHIHAVFHALADPTRRTILEKLSVGPISVSQLAIPLDMTLAAVMQHLRVLEESGLVSTQKVGRVRTCQLNPRGVAIASTWLNERKTPWEQRLDHLGELLGEKLPSKMT